MKRRIMILIITIVAMAATKNTYCQTALYNQYKHLTDVRVICIMDFPVDENVKVDITMLEPKTKEAVYTLVEEFNLGIEKDIIDKDLENEYSGLFRRIVYRSNVKKAFGQVTSADYNDISELVYNCSKGIILVFHNIETRERRIAINKFLTNTLIELEKFPSIDNANNKK